MLERNASQDSNIDKEEVGEDQQIIEQKSSISDNENPEYTKPKVTRNKRRHKRLSKTQQRIVWRRNKLSEYLVKGVSIQEVSNIMKIPYKTLFDDMVVMKNEAKENTKHHLLDLPWNIKQACDGLNQVIKILYEIQDLENAIQRRTSDNVRVLALSQIREAIKLKLEVLTSQAAVEDALSFIESTKELKIVKDQYNHDMQQVREQDREESTPILDALTNENVNGNSNVTTMTEEEPHDELDDTELEEQEQLEEEEQELASQYSQPITHETISQREHNEEHQSDADTDTQRRLQQQREQYHHNQRHNSQQ